MSIEELKQKLDITKIINNSEHILVKNGYTLEQINKMSYEEMYKLMDHDEKEGK